MVKKKGKRNKTKDKISADGCITKERILNAALAEFAANGFAGSRTEAIAKRAKINKAMLHYYFNTKQKLYDDVLERIFGGHIGEDNLIDEVRTMNISHTLKICIFLYILVNRHSRSKSNTFQQVLSWEVAEGRKNLKKIAQRYMVPRFLLLESFIKAGVNDGTFQCDNTMLAVWSLISQVAFYFMQRETYVDSEIYKPLYADVSEDILFTFLIKNFLQTLSPAKTIEIPKIPATLLKKADDFVAKMVLIE